VISNVWHILINKNIPSGHKGPMLVIDNALPQLLLL